MSWLAVIYKLACGDQEVSSTDQLAIRFPNHFDAFTIPTESETLHELITATTVSYV